MADVLPAFLADDEIASLRARALTQDGWAPGRQHSGYDILALKQVLPREPGSLVARALEMIGTPFEDYWDVYLIRYQDGAHIPPHVDEARHGKRHRRINVVLTSAREGGALWIDGVEVPLAVGDAVRFYSDREVHAVTRVGGERLLFSVGAWIEPEAKSEA